MSVMTVVSTSSVDPLASTALDASATPGAGQPMPAMESLAIGAGAAAQRMPVSPHTEFGAAADPGVGFGDTTGLEAESMGTRPSLMRRDALAPSDLAAPSDASRRLLAADAATREHELLGMGS